MILIDKTRTSTKLVLTLGEAGSFTLVLKSTYDGRDHEFVLPDSTSMNPERYDEFVVSTSVFDRLSQGRYSYEVKANEAVIERGILMVTGLKEEFVSPVLDDTDDDYVVYHG